MQYGTVPYKHRTVRHRYMYRTVRYHTEPVLYSTVPYRTVPYRYLYILHIARECEDTVRYGTEQYGTVPYKSVATHYRTAGPYHTGTVLYYIHGCTIPVQYTQYSTVQYNIVLAKRRQSTRLHHIKSAASPGFKAIYIAFFTHIS